MYFFGMMLSANTFILEDNTVSMYSFCVLPIKMMVHSNSIYCMIMIAEGPRLEFEADPIIITLDNAVKMYPVIYPA